MAQAPHRIDNHVIDSKACSLIPFYFSENWVLRDLTERDFGIDKIAERFENGYATSELLMLQIKGTEKEIDETSPRFSLETKTLIYAEMFSVPFLLLYCSVNHPEKCYYLWLQEYIRVRLNYETPSWRSQETNTLYFPPENLLGTRKAEDHLIYISQFPKYKSSWVSYYLCLNDLYYDVPSVFEYDLIGKDQADAIIKPTVSKLEASTKRLGHIPRRFIPDYLEDTIKLGKDILELKEMPCDDRFFKYIANCKTIQASVENIALRFDDSHLRWLYEYDGTADY